MRGLTGILVLAAGGFLFYVGLQEFLFCRGASEPPQQVSLADLEAGRVDLHNKYVRIGEHVNLYELGVYKATARRDAPRNAPARVEHFDYPMISTQHKLWTDLGRKEDELRAVLEKYGSLDRAPEKVEKPKLGHFAVLVRTDRFAATTDLPQHSERADAVEGMLLGRATILDTDEQARLQQLFPQQDLAKVWVLQEGRKPLPAWQTIALMAAGAVVAVAPVALFFRSVLRERRHKGKLAEPAAPDDADSPDGPAGNN